MKASGKNIWSGPLSTGETETSEFSHLIAWDCWRCPSGGESEGEEEEEKEEEGKEKEEEEQ